MQTAAEDQAQAAASDAAMLDRCKHVKIHFVTGDVHKLLLGRSKYGGMFSAITVGQQHVHLLDKQHGLASVAAPSAVLAVETAKYMLQLTSKQVSDSTHNCLTSSQCHMAVRVRESKEGRWDPGGGGGGGGGPGVFFF